MLSTFKINSKFRVALALSRNENQFSNKIINVPCNTVIVVIYKTPSICQQRFNIKGVIADSKHIQQNMTIEFETPNMVVMSPRISFSHDISQMETIPVEQYIRTRSSSSSIDFDFCVFRESFDQDPSSSADELFSGGKILPIEIKRRLLPPPSKKREPPPSQPKPPPTPPRPKNQQELNFKKEISGEMKRVVSELAEKQNCSRSFWRFKRSTSLNCGNGYARTLCPIPLLSRSHSTGSSANAKRSSTTCNNPEKYVGMKGSHCSGTGHHQKPPLKKKYGSHHGQGVKFNPVLNVPSASLFGFGSMFSCSKKKK